MTSTKKFFQLLKIGNNTMAITKQEALHLAIELEKTASTPDTVDSVVDLGVEMYKSAMASVDKELPYKFFGKVINKIDEALNG